ncbi:MAG: hypothetical protein M1830_008431 [Pleopsidium flavum]|nr:MAG: hypothetical protein M1830_008431 [Pleopsidium flavum]
MKLIALLALLIQALYVIAQSFLEATGAYSQLSSFHQLLLTNSTVAAGLLGNSTNTGSNGTNMTPQTILVPNNDAFTNYERANGRPITSLSSPDLTNIVQYHSLQGSLSSSDLQNPQGLISNTALKDQRYDNRELGSNGAQQPQVVYIGSASTNGTVVARQVGGAGAAGGFVESGLGAKVNVEVIDGKFDGGMFQIVDGFLTLPLNQSDTMLAQNLTSFVRGLDRTNVTAGTNAAKGLTCVCPSDQAFAAMNNLDKSTGNLTDGPGSLLATLTRHGFKASYYSTDFRHGDLLHSQNGYPILVTRRNGSVFLNDARLIQANAIANNGAVHGLDRVMGFLNTTTNITTPANATQYSNTANIPTPPPTASASSATSFSPSATATATSTGSGVGGGSASGSASVAAATSISVAAGGKGPGWWCAWFSGLVVVVLGGVGVL